MNIHVFTVKVKKKTYQKAIVTLEGKAYSTKNHVTNSSLYSEIQTIIQRIKI